MTRHGSYLPCLLILAASVGASCSNTVQADDWPALRGGGSGVVSPKSLLAGDEFGLKLRWKQPVGSGYSSVVVADGLVVVMFADGKDDVVAALNAGDGKPVWKVSVGPTFKGANGSFDGPLSTPLVTNGNVIALSARGRLVCVDLKTGEARWTRELATEEKAPLPLYGFTTSPILARNSVVVQIGAPDKSVIGVDPKTGETKWAAGNDRVASQTPTVYEVGQRKIVLSSGGRFLLGIDPADGTVLFQVEHGGGNGSAVTPVDLGNGLVLLTVDDSFSSAFRIQSEGDEVTAKLEWKERSIKNTYNIPVLQADSVFAFSTRFLTCIDPATGKPRWKNRKPGDGFLAVVDGKLIVSTKRGSLHIAETSPSRYEEIASLKVFYFFYWSLPAFADNAIFMRSFGAVARVDVTPGAANLAATTETEDLPVGLEFQQFLKAVSTAKSAPERTVVVDKFMTDQKSFPITEGDVVHFVYRGTCTDVAVACDVFGARQERKMVRVAGTDLHYFSMRLPSDQRANYVFLVDYKVQPDELNTNRTTSSMYAGEMEFAV
ncbi:MAG: PQQ-binding-like beta-propeller repeat protein, partial [Planctomycetaceae bacterium]